MPVLFNFRISEIWGPSVKVHCVTFVGLCKNRGDGGDGVDDDDDYNNNKKFIKLYTK